MAGGTARRTASGSAAFKTFKPLNRFAPLKTFTASGSSEFSLS
jgi:hypothetical protein